MLFARSTQLRSTLGCLLLLAYLPACSSWQAVGPSPEEFVRTRAPATIRVTRNDSSRVELRAPAVRGDTLVGTVGGGLARDNQARQLAVPLSEAHSVAVRRFSAGNTLALVGGILGGLTLIAIVSCSGSDNYAC